MTVWSWSNRRDKATASNSLYSLLKKKQKQEQEQQQQQKTPPDF